MTCKRYALIDFKGVDNEEAIALFLGTAREMGANVQVAGTLAPDPVESFDPFADLNDEETHNG